MVFSKLDYNIRKSMRKPWIAFFSQTGAEIADIAAVLGYWPDAIVTNSRPAEIRKVDERLNGHPVLTMPNKPKLKDYEGLFESLEVLFGREVVVTLHGWLRVVPLEIVMKWEMYNGHPGNILMHPKLKGFNPQEKAFKLKLTYSGCVIHRVGIEVDEGEILLVSKVYIEGLVLNEIYSILRVSSLSLWTEFLPDVLKK